MIFQILWTFIKFN